MERFHDLDKYVNISNELSEIYRLLEKEALDKLKHITFALIGPEGTSPLFFNRIISLIEQHGFEILDYEFFFKVDEEKIEKLYKYHVADALKSRLEYENSSCDYKNYCPYLGLVPTRNWRLLRKRFDLGISIGLILICNSTESAPQYFNQIKGSPDPFLCKDNHIRKYIDNPVNSHIHSSDELQSALRELSIFFDFDRFNESMTRNEIIEFQEFNNVCNFSIPDPTESRFLVISIKIRLRIALKLIRMHNIDKAEKDNLYNYYFNFYETSKNIFVGIEMLTKYASLIKHEKFFLDKIPNKNSEHIHVQLCYQVLQMLNDKKNYRNFDSAKFIYTLKLLNVVCSDQEMLILESGLWYYREE